MENDDVIEESYSSRDYFTPTAEEIEEALFVVDAYEKMYE